VAMVRARVGVRVSAGPEGLGRIRVPDVLEG
jgi:hypothetical protein